jgi:hypothetical protein
MENNNNTITGFHIHGNKDGKLLLNTSTLYHWHIPKFLREDPIQPGDIVLVRTVRGAKAVVVMQVFREEFEETQRRYKRIIKVIERAPEKDLVHSES